MRRVRGFTLIEVLVTTMIFGILVALGVPSLRVWIANTQVRAVADSLQNGLRLAQTESLRRSRIVVLSLTTSAPNSQASFNGITAAGNGTNWAISVIPAMTDGTDANTFIQSGVLTATSTTAGITVNGPAEICFNSAGRLVANGATGVAGGTCTLPTSLTPGTPPVWVYQVSRQGSVAGSDRPLNVQVDLGGQVRLCDPSSQLSGSNTYGC
jgi:type IV fimbrial biogenesis protein FimT